VHSQFTSVLLLLTQVYLDGFVDPNTQHINRGFQFAQKIRDFAEYASSADEEPPAKSGEFIA
jgi:hypothetical protein